MSATNDKAAFNEAAENFVQLFDRGEYGSSAGKHAFMTMMRSAPKRIRQFFARAADHSVICPMKVTRPPAGQTYWEWVYSMSDFLERLHAATDEHSFDLMLGLFLDACDVENEIQSGSENLTTAFYETAGAYFALKSKGFDNVLVALRARTNMMRHVPLNVELELGEVGKRTFLNKEDEYEAEDDVMRAGWLETVEDIRARLLTCKNEDVALELYLILQDSNRIIGVETEPFGECAPLIGPAIAAATTRSRDLLNKIMGKGTSS